MASKSIYIVVSISILRIRCCFQTSNISGLTTFQTAAIFEVQQFFELCDQNCSIHIVMSSIFHFLEEVTGQKMLFAVLHESIFQLVFPFDGFLNIQNFSSLTPYSFKHFHKKCLFTIKSSLFCFLFSVQKSLVQTLKVLKKPSLKKASKKLFGIALC